MTDNGKLDLWERLGRTDPKHTSRFQRAGGFKGTAIRPIYSYQRMTEEYGPCGIGWGVGEPSFQTLNGADGEVLVYCTVSIWHGDKGNLVFGVGGDKVVNKFSSGLKSDDEAFKKAFTDAVTNALKLIGVGADVHMGLFDDSKYVNEMKQEFSKRPEIIHETLPEDVGPVSDQEIIKRDPNIQVLTVDAQRPIFAELGTELHRCETVEELKRWKISARSRASRLSDSWRKMLEGKYLEHLRELEKRDADEYIEKATGS